MKARFHATVLAFIFLAASGTIHAQSSYPTGRISLLFGLAAGNDVGARIVAGNLSEGLGKPVVIENVTGAAGNIAADRIANADADGHTVGMLTAANVILRPLLNRSVPYEPLKRLVPVSLAYRLPNILAVSNDFNITTLSELVERARNAPGALTFGHLGIGSVAHLSGELLNIWAKTDIRGVPYSGAPAFLTDMIAGRITMAFVPPSVALPLVQSGRFCGLAVTSRMRAPFAPDLPTVAELGYPDFDITVWFGMFAPAGTPQPIIDRLNQEVMRVMRLPDVQKRFSELGLVPIGNTQAEFDQLIATETLFWIKLIKDAGIKPIE